VSPSIPLAAQGELARCDRERLRSALAAVRNLNHLTRDLLFNR
jgi:hypothetical protein